MGKFLIKWTLSLRYSWHFHLLTLFKSSFVSISTWIFHKKSIQGKLPTRWTFSEIKYQQWNGILLYEWEWCWKCSASMGHHLASQQPMHVMKYSPGPFIWCQTHIMINELRPQWQEIVELAKIRIEGSFFALGWIWKSKVKEQSERTKWGSPPCSETVWKNLVVSTNFACVTIDGE